MVGLRLERAVITGESDRVHEDEPATIDGNRGCRVKALRNDSGVTLIETMIAVLVALIGVFSIGSLIFQATVTNKNQGTEVTRATIYAQDKIEKLLSLGFSDCNQSLTSNPNYCDTAATWAYASGSWTATAGITGTGWNTGLLAGGQLTTGDASAPMQSTCPSSGLSVGYVDYLDFDGSQVPATAGACTTLTTPIAYVRMWQVQDVASTGGPTMKQITVAVWSVAAVGAKSTKPVVVVTSYLSNPN
jgi:Tfp pilus assembly protein PilV